MMVVKDYLPKYITAKISLDDMGSPHDNMPLFITKLWLQICSTSTSGYFFRLREFAA